MSPSRAALVVAAVSVIGAAFVALVARAPADLRNARPDTEAFSPELKGRFSERQQGRARAYRRPSYAAFATYSIVEIVTLLVLAAGPFRAMATALEGVRGGWPVRALLLGAIVAFLLSVSVLPVSFVRGYVMEHAWDLSTQDLGGWMSDRLRKALVGAAIAAIGSVAFFGVVRLRPQTWWLWGWAAFTGLSALLAFVWPVVIAPLFNEFTPLTDRDLARRAEAVARRAGIEIDEVLVADASRRTRAENAYVAGIGATKRLVLYDTLLAAGERETLFVVAHELGHEAENHVLKGVALSSLGLLAGFGILALLARGASAVWGWAGAEGIFDLRALPLVVLYATVAGLVLLPAQNLVSRAFERRADEIAFELTGDPQAAVAAFRRLALVNLADLDPPKPVVWTLYTHPPIRERIANALVAGVRDF